MTANIRIFLLVVGNALALILSCLGLATRANNWRCRVLRRGGMLFAEEPDGHAVDTCDQLFHWGHAKEAMFRLEDLERHLEQTGLVLLQKKYVMGFGIYAAQKK